MKRSDRQIKQQLDTEVAGSSDMTRMPTYSPVPRLTENFSVLLRESLNFPTLVVYKL